MDQTQILQPTDTNGKKKKKMTPWDWAILTGKVALHAAAAPVKGALWALERPQ